MSSGHGLHVPPFAFALHRVWAMLPVGYACPLPVWFTMPYPALHTTITIDTSGQPCNAVTCMYTLLLVGVLCCILWPSLPSLSSCCSMRVKQVRREGTNG